MLFAIAFLNVCIIVLLVYLLLNRSGSGGASTNETAALLQTFGDRQIQAIREEFRTFREEMAASAGQSREESGRSSRELRDELAVRIMNGFSEITKHSAELSTQLTQEVKARLEEVTKQVSALSDSNEKRQEVLRVAVEGRLDQLNQTNSLKLEEMRQTVDEKLHSTLEKRLTESFGLVTDQLGKVQLGLGEMKDLATGVGDLKRVLTNVKVRGGFAEVQLGLQLEQMLAPDQYSSNVRVKPNTQEQVEFAIRLPNGESGELLLPIDAKFPKEDWERLEEAQSSGDAAAVAAAGKGLEATIRSEAKKINDKYVAPPATTNFAVMYLPTEGLFSEVVRRPGLVDDLQTKYRVCVAGPTTFMALLTSLQMGFKTLAIQNKGIEVWNILAAAKGEFGKFGVLMTRVENQVNTVQNTLSEINKKTKTINRKLSSVETVSTSLPASPLFSLQEDSEDDESASAAAAGTVD